MQILVIEDDNVWMTGILFALDKMGHKVTVYQKSVQKLAGDEEQEREMEIFLKDNRVDFVLSIIFSKETARVTNRLGLKYVVWVVDSPAFPAWVPEAEYDNCYLFYFDYREYELKKNSGQSNAYHLPLAADLIWNGQLVITDDDIKKHACNMSFVGGLYTENLYDYMIGQFPLEMQEAFTVLMENSVLLWDGQDRLRMPPELVQAVRHKCPQIFNDFDMPDEYYLRTSLLGKKLTQVERILLMDLLAQQFDIHLYTRDTERVPESVKRFPPVHHLKEAPKVFYSSRINLNITLRSIASGVPARVFDIMSVGGFVLSNWQEEIPELFVEDEEIVTYKTPEELLDKADYYLKHEDRRTRIGINGYQKVKKQHTYEHRLDKMISVIQGKE